MSDDLDLRGIDSHYEPSPQFRAALKGRVAAIVDGIDPGSVTEARDMEIVDFEMTSAPSAPNRNRRLVAQVILAAAAVVVIALVATRDDESTPADQPAPTVTVTPTAPPRALITAERNPEQLVPGTYFADWFSESVTPMRFFVTVGAGWTIGADGWNPTDYRDQFPLGLLLWKAGGVDGGNQAGGLGFSLPGDEVFSDACHPSKGSTPGDVATVDGLVDALRAQAGWADVTTASDISVDGYAGSAFHRTAPTDMSGCDTAGPGGLRDGGFGMHPDFRSWEDAAPPYEAGETETVWVLDIDGTVVVINARLYSDASEADNAKLAAALDSVRIMASPDEATPADQPSPTVTVPATAPPRAIPNVLKTGDTRTYLEPGTYYLDSVDGTPTPRIFATLDTGWTDPDNRTGWSMAKSGMPGEGGIGLMTIGNPVAVFSDACHPTDGFHPGPVTTVDGFITALMEQQGGWVDVTTPSNISIDGYAGKAFQRTAPADMSDCTTRDGGPIDSGQAPFPSWESAVGINGGYSPGQIETLWVLDIDGTVVVIFTELFPGQSATALADFADPVLDSIRIERP